MSEFLKAPKDAPKHPLSRHRNRARSGHKIGPKQIGEVTVVAGIVDLLATACTPQTFQAPIEAGPITGTADIALSGVPANLQGSLSGDCVKLQFDQNGPMIQGVQLNFNPPSAHIVPAPGSEGVVTGKALIGMKNGDGTCTDPAAEVAFRVTVDTDPTVCSEKAAQGNTALLQCDGPGTIQENGQVVAVINGNQVVVNMNGARAKDFVVVDTVGNTSTVHAALPTTCQVSPTDIRLQPGTGQIQMHAVCDGPGEASTAAGAVPIVNNEAWVPLPPGQKDFTVDVKFDAFQTKANGHVPDLKPPVLTQDQMAISGGKNIGSVNCQTALQDTCTVQVGPATVQFPGDGAHPAQVSFPATLGEQSAVQAKACDTLNNCTPLVATPLHPYKPFDGISMQATRTGDNQITVQLNHPDPTGSLSGPGTVHGQQERPFRDVPWIQEAYAFGQQHGLAPSPEVNCFPTQQTREATIFTCDTPHSHGTVHLTGALVDANGNWSPGVQGMVPVPDFPGPVMRAAEAGPAAGISLGILVIVLELYLLYQLHRTNKHKSRRLEAMDIVNSTGLPKEAVLTKLEEELKKNIRDSRTSEVLSMLAQKKELEAIRRETEKSKRMFVARPYAQFRETFAHQDKQYLILHDYEPFVHQTEETGRLVLARLDEIIGSFAQNDGRYLFSRNQNDRDEAIRFLTDAYRDGEESWFWQNANMTRQQWKNDRPDKTVRIYPHLTRENLQKTIIRFHAENGTLDQERTALFNLFNPKNGPVQLRQSDITSIARQMRPAA